MRAILLGLLATISVSSFAKQVKPDWKYVEWRLSQTKADQKFIHAMKDIYTAKDFNEVVELNVLLFLRKTDYHGPQVTAEAVKDVQKFLKENSQALAAAEHKYKVPGPTVASLLWMESRYGGNLGRFNVASVFMDLIQADRPEMITHLKNEAHRFTSRHITSKTNDEITERAQKKSKWALGEMEALSKMYDRNAHMVITLKGSFSGAFGMPQFLPSSYNHWARSASPGVTPDLSAADDAIHSVAYYLHDAGWRGARHHVQALMRYNNSRDYANAILKLAKRAQAQREISSVSTKMLKKKKKFSRRKPRSPNQRDQLKDQSQNHHRRRHIT